MKILDYLQSYDGKPLRFMEVCGTHTAEIHRNGAAFATGVLPYIYAFHRYTWSSTVLFCTQVARFPMHFFG